MAILAFASPDRHNRSIDGRSEPADE